MPVPDDTNKQNQQPTNVNSSGSEPTPQADPPPTPQAAPSPQPAPTQDPPKGKGAFVTPDRFAAMRKEERVKGHKEVMSRLDKDAVSLGYKSHQDMIETLRKNKQQPSQQATQQRAPMGKQDRRNNQPQNQPRDRNRDRRNNRGRDDAEVEKLRADNARLTKSLNSTERKRREAERARAQVEADAQLRESAARVGLQDIDYALHLIKKDPKVLRMTKEERVAFDEVKYFSDLRETHPQLFGVTKAPANTTPTTTTTDPSKVHAPALAPGAPGTETTPPPPGQEQTNGKGNPIDARELTQADYQARLKSLGIDPNAPI